MNLTAQSNLLSFRYVPFKAELPLSWTDLSFNLHNVHNNQLSRLFKNLENVSY